MTGKRRKHLSAKERVRLFELHKGICHICKQKIQVGEKWELEHLIPWELTRDDSDENVKPAHDHCHKPKTKKDTQEIRKADRIRAKHLGCYPKSRARIQSRGFPKTRDW
jgi:5-methylcytosine-specific restriction endonuclease McrA